MTTDSFRKISKGGQKHVRRHLGGGGGGGHTVGSIQFEGLQFQGVHKVLKGGGGGVNAPCPP